MAARLPWGWAAARDADSGRTYFYNAWRRHSVTWERPLPNRRWDLLAALVAAALLPSAWLLQNSTEPILRSPRSTWSSDGEELLSELFWRGLGRTHGLKLSVSGTADLRTTVRLDHVQLRSKMRRDGYIHLPELGLDSMSSLASMIDDLELKGLPAQFILIFDEVWTVVHRAEVALAPLFGLQSIQDFYVFNVQPGAAGWPIHRDRSGDDSAASGFTTEKLPLSTTVWIALTDATPLTSCIYCVPAHADANYASQAAEDVASEILAVAHQFITALPVLQGGVLAWSHRLLHWGSASPPDASSRKALAFTMASPGFEEPTLVGTASHPPPFEARLGLIA